MSEKTKEEEAFQAHKKRFEWLELVTHDGATRLGCKLCKEHNSSSTSAFAQGMYQIEKYFYTRTLNQHENSAVHKESLRAAKATSTPAAPSTPPGTPPKSACLKSPGSHRKSPRSKAASPSESRAASSVAASPAEKDKSSKTADRFFNLVAGAYTSIFHEKSSQDFVLLVDYARACGGNLPGQHDSETIFSEIRDLIAARAVEKLVEQVTSSPFFAVSIDEKDRFLIVVLSFFANGAVVTVPVAYKDMPGFEAQDLFNLVRSLLDSCTLLVSRPMGRQ